MTCWLNIILHGDQNASQPNYTSHTFESGTDKKCTCSFTCGPKLSIFGWPYSNITTWARIFFELKMLCRKMGRNFKALMVPYILPKCGKRWPEITLCILSDFGSFRTKLRVRRNFFKETCYKEMEKKVFQTTEGSLYWTSKLGNSTTMWLQTSSR